MSEKKFSDNNWYRATEVFHKPVLVAFLVGPSVFNTHGIP